ncbi:hypothetical protein KUTeg_021320 [Tegillarca granosa]|uniref:Uncharacterized protein n=1 Tax=Tegillarca granosa TaxID=220873 RepID=A0ABQ9EAH3_TEGGR|nr:hypothetical protein KUTeg_021320 [Tegillarca granosa]
MLFSYDYKKMFCSIYTLRMSTRAIMDNPGFDPDVKAKKDVIPNGSIKNKESHKNKGDDGNNQNKINDTSQEHENETNLVVKDSNLLKPYSTAYGFIL